MAGDELVRIETNILPRAQLLVVFAGLASALLITFVDQNAIGVALPTIGTDLNCATTIGWAGTSNLIANTSFQVLYGRLSDIFGRKVMFLSAIVLLGAGDLLCGFAQTGPQLYAFRGIAGIGGGGLSALSMMVVSDIVTLEERGKYQGILGACVGIGNSIGPFMSAAFVEKATWRGIFWTICPMVALAGVAVAFTLPPSKVHGSTEAKIKAIDYWGVVTSSTAIILLLIPISGGGIYFEWNSPMSISMLVIGGISMILFVVVEWKFARMPMMPLHLFGIPAVGAILAQNFLYGIVYYSQLYYLPIYYQNAHQFSVILSAVLILPVVLTQSCCSIFSGQYISRIKRYGEIIWIGFTMWTLGSGLILRFQRSTPMWEIIVTLIVQGVGVGFVFQPTLVAAQAHTRKQDRAVVISVRNFLRCLGGAIGLAIGSAIFEHVLESNLDTLSVPIPDATRSSILASILHVPDLSSLTAAQQDEILDAYMFASRAVFTMWVPVMGLCLLLCFLIKDRGLQRAEEKSEENNTTPPSEIREATPPPSVNDIEKQVPQPAS